MEDHNALGEMVRDLMVKETGEAQSLSEMEQKIRQVMKWLGNMVVHLWLAWQETRYAERKRQCPHCGGEAKYERKRGGCLHTMFGRVRYWRAYYLCESCHQGHYPLDEELGLRPNQMSAEVERLAGLVGVQEAFGKGSVLFEELTLVKLSDQSLDKAAQAYGAEVQKQEAEWEAESQDSEAMLRRQRQSHPPLRLYGSMDGGRVQTRAPKGEEQPWRELKTLAWFQAKGKPPKKPGDSWAIQAEDITYAADICTAETFGTLLWASGVQRNVHLAAELIFLGDGARWIWDLVTTYFPQAIQIVDWFHACEYLTPVAKVAFRDPKKQALWTQQVTQFLWEGQLDDVIAACACHVDPQRQDDPAQKALTYYSNNRHRMDYPTYRANGYHIGSGTIESGIKQIAQKRMKISGARWNLDSARFVAKARAAFLSNQWNRLAFRRENLTNAA